MTATTTAPVAAAPVRTTRQPSTRLRAWATRAPLLPALIFMIAVTQLPFVATLVISFFDWNALYPKARHFTGVDNYHQVLADPDLRHSVWTTILLTVTVVLACLVLGLGLALLLDRRFRGRGVVRTLLIAPFLVVPVAAALLWKHVLYNPSTAFSTACCTTWAVPSRTGSPTPRCSRSRPPWCGSGRPS